MNHVPAVPIALHRYKQSLEHPRGRSPPPPMPALGVVVPSPSEMWAVFMCRLLACGVQQAMGSGWAKVRIFSFSLTVTEEQRRQLRSSVALRILASSCKCFVH